MRPFAVPRNSSAARERVLEDCWIAPTEQGPVEYFTLGAGSPVLVLTARPGGRDPDIAHARGLTLQGFRIVAPSGPMTQGRCPPDRTPEADVDTWAALLDALAIRRAPVVALPGAVPPAVQFALRHPERVSALVLMMAGAGSGPAPRRWRDAPEWDRHPVWVLMRERLGGTHTLVAVRGPMVAALSARERADLEDAIAGIRGSLERLSTPTLLVSAADDLYDALPVAPHLARGTPWAARRVPEPGWRLGLSRGVAVWPAVAAFLEQR